MNGRWLERKDLDPATKEAMFVLFKRYFHGVTKEQFRQDLNQKDFVILLEDDYGVVRGFTSMLHFNVMYHGEMISVIYSGDTIVDQEVWGSPILPATWLSVAERLRLEHPDQKLYWLLICSGFRTYRFMPVFWKRFFPSCRQKTPVQAQALLNFLGTTVLGDSYQPALGVAQFETPQVLVEGPGLITPERLRNKDIAFFAAANPGYAGGDELLCLTEITPENQTRAGRRLHTLSSTSLSAV